MNRRKQPLCAESKSFSRAEPRESGGAYLTDTVQAFLVIEDRVCHLSSFGPRLLLSPNSFRQIDSCIEGGRELFPIPRNSYIWHRAWPTSKRLDVTGQSLTRALSFPHSETPVCRTRAVRSQGGMPFAHVSGYSMPNITWLVEQPFV